MTTVLALDIGGTKVAAGRVDRSGAILGRAVRPTPAGTDPEVVWAAVAEVLAEARGGDEVRCGVGCGGPMTSGGATVSPLNVGAWRGFPLRARVEAFTGLATAVDNDAKALALGEGWIGRAAGARDYLAMVVSTGVGGGIVLDGRLLDGREGNAGHIGHVVVEPGGRRCGCGARGCLEAEASGTAIAELTGAPAAEAPEEVRVRAGRLVGRAVGSVANLLDLRLAVVAGSVALGYGATFFEAARAELAETACLDHSRGASIEPAGLGADGPLVGAAAVALRAMGVEGFPG
ncbi:MAG: ROK family protein [Acidimicrobiia bacterium]